MENPILRSKIINSRIQRSKIREIDPSCLKNIVVSFFNLIFWGAAERLAQLTLGGDVSAMDCSPGSEPWVPQICPRFSLVFPSSLFGFPWFSVVLHGFSRFSFVFLGSLLFSLVFLGFP